MTDAYNAGRAAGIREAAAVVQQMQDRKQVVWPKDILALLDSAPAPAGVTVKPLVWTKTSSGTSRFPAWSSDNGMVVESLNMGGFCWGGQSFDTLDAAKAAAQADYEARILAALEPAPAGVTVDDQEQAFMAAVWEALKADANDLRKQKRILSAFRSVLSGDRTAPAPAGVTVQEAARLICDEVLQKPCPVAGMQRVRMINATLSVKIPSIPRAQRWAIVNAALRALSGDRI
jgi:hypothetical protein